MTKRTTQCMLDTFRSNIMGGFFSKPKVPGPSPAQMQREREALAAQQEQKAALALQEKEEENKKIAEMKKVQDRARLARYGGVNLLLAERENPELGMDISKLG